MAGANMQHFNDGNFEAEVLKSSVPVLVDFWAEWCAPCKALMPTIEAVASEFQGRAKVGKADLEQTMSNAAKLGVQSIPTVLIFKGGKVVSKIVGVKSKTEFTTALEAAAKL